ncbi:MAG: ATP-binding protein, partial [bacterium]
LRHLAKVGKGYSEGLSKAADGTEIPVEIRVSRISYDNKPALLFHVHDISDRKKLETQLLHSQKLEAIGRLAGGVAHDFNNLLTVIMGSTEFGLHSCEPNDKIRTELLNIKRAAKQASEFTKQLLAFSRSQIHKPRTIHLNQLIAEHVMMLKHVIGEDIELETDCDQELAPIWGDPVQIQQILMNICVNSRDAMPNGGRLLIKTRKRNGDDPDWHQDAGLTDSIKETETNFAEITIRDTGVGMDKQTVSQIFEPFFTTKDVGKGTGLGLSLVYGIVRQHHGCIHVESEPAQGTTIKLSFPAATEQEDVQPEEKKTTSSMFGKETILLVEDEEAVLNVGQRILKGFGYDVITAQDGHLAIELLEEKAAHIDLVLLDVVMPKLSGPETFKKLRVIRPNLPVIFVTGYDAKTELNGLEETSDAPFAVLQKPYSKNSLGEIVRELLERKRTDARISV